MMPRFPGTRMLLACLFLAAWLLPGPAAGEEPAVADESLPGAAPAGTVAETATPQGPASPGNVHVSVDGGLLSVRVEDAGLVEVMEELSRQSGMRIKLDRGASKQISLAFGNMPFEQGVRNLIRPLGYAMVWRRSQDADGNEVEILEELHIFREGHQGGAVVELRPPELVEEAAAGPTPVTKRVWDEETRRRMLEKMRIAPSAP